MKYLVALLAAAVFFLAPIPAASSSGWTPSDVESLVRSTGCKAPITTSPLRSVFDSAYLSQEAAILNSMFITGDETDRLYVGIEAGESDDIMRTVILHESAHCLQFEQFGLTEGAYQMNQMKYELAADTYAANKLCSMGYDGKKIARDIMDRAHDDFGYNGDEDHGTLDQRAAAALNAPACAEQQQ